MTAKICSGCKTEKDIADFWKNKTSSDSLQGWCKACIKRNQKTDIGKATSKKNMVRYYGTIKGCLSHKFQAMIDRCTNPNYEGYKNYGGRGIRVLFESLDDFRSHVMDDLGVDPRGLDIDRIDNNGHYERGNIRFVTRSENLLNRSCIKR